MFVDVSTAFFLLMATCLIVSVMLLLAWDQNRSQRAYIWWSGGFAVGAAGLGLSALPSVLPDAAAAGLGTVLVLLGLGLCWAGARSFDSRPINAWPVAIGVLAWTAIYMIPEVQNSEPARSALTSILIGFYSLSIGAEFWHGRGDALASRLPLAFLCGFNGVVHLVRVFLALVLPSAATTVAPDLWLALSLFQPALIMVAGGLYGIGLGRDRTELELRRTAEIDSLTGVLNRGALMERSSRTLAAMHSGGQAVGLLVFDLDRFKSINDSYGHLVGDRVLATFAEVVRECLRTSDLVGRIGGEEFAALLPGLDTATASVVAERVRREFARRRPTHEGMTVLATVSIGVASLPARDANIDALLALADRALYDAKRSGRDQVRTAALAMAV